MSAISGYSSPSSASYADQLKNFFKSADTDKSGGVTQAELEKAGQKLPTGKFASGVDAESLTKYIDKNGDGSLSTAESDAFVTSLTSEAQAYMLQTTKPEQPAAVRELLGKMDLDGSGDVSAGEAKAYGKQLQTEMLANVFGGGKSSGSGTPDIASLMLGNQAYSNSSDSMSSLAALLAKSVSTSA